MEVYLFFVFGSEAPHLWISILIILYPSRAILIYLARRNESGTISHPVDNPMA